MVVGQDIKKSFDKRIIYAAVALVIIIAAGAFLILKLHTDSVNHKAASFKANGKLLTNKPVTTNIVTISPSGFQPTTMTVKKGTTVSWFNLSNSKQTVTEDDGQTGPNSGSIAPKLIYQYVYNQLGTFKYHSAIATNMTGTIVVTNSGPSSSAAASSSVAGSSSAAAWKIYTLKYEKLSFQYPSNWQLKDSSGNGQDMITLTGPNSFVVSIQTGSGAPSATPGVNLLFARPTTAIGRAVYLDGLSDQQSSSLVGQTYVSTSNTNAYAGLPAKNTQGLIVIHAGYAAGPGETLTALSKDQNYIDAETTLASMHY